MRALGVTLAVLCLTAPSSAEDPSSPSSRTLLIEVSTESLDRQGCRLRYALWSAADGGTMLAGPVAGSPRSRPGQAPLLVEIDLGRDDFAGNWLGVSALCEGSEEATSLGRWKLDRASLTAYP